MTNAYSSGVVPLRNPSVAETLSSLAEVMGYKSPSAIVRRFAGPHPVCDDEREAVSALYAGIENTVIRQAILDVLVAAARRDCRL